VLNLGCEGIMLIGAAVSFLIVYFTNDIFLGVIVAVIVCALIGLLHAFLTVILKANQLIIGLSIWIMGMGLSSLLYRVLIGIRQALPEIPILKDVKTPLLSDIPIIGPILFNQNVLVYLAYILVLLIYVILFKTSIGLSIRATGENPEAVDVLGINVFRLRCLCVICGAALMGLGGSYLPLAEIGTFTEGITGGRGWIALALVIFGRWNPAIIFLGSLFFAGVEVLQYYLQITTNVPYQFLLMLPYATSIAVLIYVYRRAEAPAALAKPYERGERV
ncbi:ABC transporter permease, partial [Nanoarchaeota archaeon NZ13-N]